MNKPLPEDFGLTAEQVERKEKLINFIDGLDLKASVAIGIFAYLLFLISLPIWSFGIGIAIFHLIILGPILAVFAMLTVTPLWS